MTAGRSQSFELSPSQRNVFVPTPTLARDPAELVSGPSNPLREFFKRNKGLFIIAASQFFFSLMNLSVKILTALDDPVPTLEVCRSPPSF